MKFLLLKRQVFVSLLLCICYYSTIQLVELTITTVATVNAFVVIPCHRYHDLPTSVPRRHKTTTHLNAVVDPPLKIPSSKEQEKESKETNKKNKSFFANMFQNKSLQCDSLFIITIDNILDYKSQVVNEMDDIVVVRFYAKWCRSCKASEPIFMKLVSRYDTSDTSTNNKNKTTKAVKFVQVPLNKQTDYLYEGLGVPSFPFAHIYHPDVGLVEEMKISRPHFSKFETVLDSYVRGSCDVDSYKDEDEGNDFNVCLLT